MISFGETRSTWFKYLPNWGRFNNRDQLNPGKKRKKKKSEGKKKKKGSKSPPSLSPRPGLAHTICCSLTAAAGGGGRRGRAGLTLAHTRPHTRPHAPRTIVSARPPRFLGVFCSLPSAELRAPARAAPERHIHYRPGADFKPLPSRLHCSPGGQAPPPFVWRGGDWPAPGGGLPSPLGKPIHLCTWALDSASY